MNKKFQRAIRQLCIPKTPANNYQADLLIIIMRPQASLTDCYAYSIAQLIAHTACPIQSSGMALSKCYPIRFRALVIRPYVQRNEKRRASCLPLS